MRAWRLASLSALLWMLALLTPASALALASHPFLGAIKQPLYEDACGAAFGPGGLYVSSYYQDEIEGPISISNEAPHGGPCKLAFDGEGNLYVDNWHRDVVRYRAGELEAGAAEVIDPESPAAAETPTGLAVDPATGNLFVTHRTFISEYAAPVHAGETPTTIGSDPGAAYYGIAVSGFPATAGYLYVPDAADATVKVFDPVTSTSSPVEAISGEATPQGGFEDLVESEALVDNDPTSPSYGHLYVLDAIGHGLSAHPEGALDEFNAQGDYRGQVKGFADAEPSGVAIAAETGDLYVTSGNSEGSAVFTYGPTAPAATLTVDETGAGGGRVVSSPVGIACGGACAAEFSEGEKVTLVAMPDAHSAFAGWSVTGAESCPGTGTCTVLMSHAIEITARFEEPAQETLSAATTGSGEGTVSSGPAGISCPGACSEHFAQGRLVTLTATPAPHSRFVEWLGAACDEGTQPSCQVTMSHAESVTAKFEPIPQLPLEVTKLGSGQGTVSSSPSALSCPGLCLGDFDEGSTVTLVAAPAPGSSFAGFSGGGCSGAAPICEVQMSQARAVAASFEGAAAGPADSLAELRLGRAVADGGRASLALTLPTAGTVLALGRDLRPVEAQLSAGPAALRLALSRAGRRALARAPRHRLRVRALLAFIPAAGGPDSSARREILFGPGRRAEGKSARGY